MLKLPDYFPEGINSYVPAMQYNAQFEQGIGLFSLGTPAASDDDIIDDSVDADAVAGTIETQSYVSDSPFGRNLILTVSGDPGAAGGVVDVYGFDYLGQPMKERFTGANGATAILYGKKAFYRVTKTVIVTATTNAVTYKLGTGTWLGLPYKGDIVWAKENGVNIPLYNRDTWFWSELDAASVAGGPSGVYIDIPMPGWVKGFKGISTKPAGSTTDPVITVATAAGAITGLGATVDVSALGNEQSDVPTTEGYSAATRIRPGDNVQILVADADGSSGLKLGVEIATTSPLQGDETDPATATTRDPRPIYEPYITMDGAKEILVAMRGDPTVNASGNGGLHGIRHYFA